ncbi:homeobox protein B-H1-like [Ananas comosus]|uniref:Homeobox protein B-H1-like n=1 Tax=Ananas comosus TaxID=4615 RepID=A0A6P5EMV4_ANACO|nr:homeobox protein B-H1-like [Ananas comosus]
MAAAKKPPPHPHPHPHPHPRPLRGVIPPPILKQWGGGGVGGGGETERGLEELRKKLMGHLREAADRMELAAIGLAPYDAAPERADAAVAARRRRGRGSEARRVRGLRRRGERGGGGAGVGRALRAAAQAPRRDPEAPRIVQRRLDSLFPGLWLSEVSVDLYKVPDE